MTPFKKPSNKSGEMLAEAVVGGFNDEFVPAITTRGQFSTIINLDEDRPHKIFILMAPNYPQQSPATQRAPVPFKKYTWNLIKVRQIDGRERRTSSARLSPFFVLINDPQQQNVPYIAARLCRSAALTGLDLRWRLMQFLQVGCHSDPLAAFIFTTDESLGSQRSPRGSRARQLLSRCSSGGTM